MSIQAGEQGWRLRAVAAAVLVVGVQAAAQAQTQAAATTPPEQDPTLETVQVLGTAESAWKQAPGVSTVTREDLDSQPSNDLADDRCATAGAANATPGGT